MLYSMESIIRQAYYDPEQGFQSAIKLYKKLRINHPEITLKQVKEFIKSQETNQIHAKQVIPEKEYNQIIAVGIGQFQCDLLDLSNYKRENSNYRYLLVM